MGQYYHPINIDKQEYVYSHDFNNGLKLMEHSWIGNNFMEAVETLLSKGNNWYKTRLVWAGDYMDNGIFIEEFKDSIDREKVKEHYEANDDESIEKIISELSLYSLCDMNFRQIPHEECGSMTTTNHNFIVNYTTNEYIDKRFCPIMETSSEGVTWVIHPLSLMTSSGNGRGGGDFRGENDYVGQWAGHVIAMEEEVPDGFKEIVPCFMED